MHKYLLTTVLTLNLISLGTLTTHAATLGWKFSVNGNFGYSSIDDIDLPPSSINHGLIEGRFYVNDSALSDGFVDPLEVTDWMVSWTGGMTPDFQLSKAAGDYLFLIFDENNHLRFETDSIRIVFVGYEEFAWIKTDYGEEFAVRQNRILDQVHPDYSTNPEIKIQPVPEPLTILGVGTAIAFGANFKSKLGKAKKK